MIITHSGGPLKIEPYGYLGDRLREGRDLSISVDFVLIERHAYVKNYSEIMICMSS